MLPWLLLSLPRAYFHLGPTCSVKNEDPNVRRSQMGKNRMEAFSDRVQAIIITIKQRILDSLQQQTPYFQPKKLSLD